MLLEMQARLGELTIGQREMREADRQMVVEELSQAPLDLPVVRWTDEMSDAGRGGDDLAAPGHLGAGLEDVNRLAEHRFDVVARLVDHDIGRGPWREMAAPRQ